MNEIARSYDTEEGVKKGASFNQSLTQLSVGQLYKDPKPLFDNIESVANMKNVIDSWDKGGFDAIMISSHHITKTEVSERDDNLIQVILNKKGSSYFLGTAYPLGEVPG